MHRAASDGASTHAQSQASRRDGRQVQGLRLPRILSAARPTSRIATTPIRTRRAANQRRAHGGRWREGRHAASKGEGAEQAAHGAASTSRLSRLTLGFLRAIGGLPAEGRFVDAAVAQDGDGAGRGFGTAS